MIMRFLTLLVALVSCADVASPITASPIQEKERKIEKETFPREPVKLAGVKNKKRKLHLGEKFTGDDDWMDGFTVTILNTSGKDVNSLSIDLTFVRPPDHETSNDPPLGYPLRFNPSPFSPEYKLRDRSRIIRPGERLDLTLRDDEYEGIKRFLEELKYPSVHRVLIQIHTVGFEDGTAWGAGTTFYRDPDKPDRLVPEPEPLRQGAQSPCRFYFTRLSPARHADGRVIHQGVSYAAAGGTGKTVRTFCLFAERLL